MPRDDGTVNLVMVVRRIIAERVLGLEDRVSHQLPRMLVCELVEHARALLAAGHKTRKSQFCQVLRDCSWCFFHDVRQFVDGQLFATQREDDAYPCDVGEHGKHFDGQFDELTVGFRSTASHICIHTQIIAQERGDCPTTQLGMGHRV